MSHKDWMITSLLTGCFVAGLGVGCVFSDVKFDKGKEDCEKDLPRTQECTLQWVKPEVSK